MSQIKKIIFLVLTLIFSSCAAEFPEPSSSHDNSTDVTGKVSVSFTLSDAATFNPSTRSSIYIDERTVKTILLAAYNEGILETYIRTERTDSLSLTLCSGKTYNLYAIANDTGHEPDCLESDFRKNSSVHSINNENGTALCPMSWKLEEHTVSSNTDNVIEIKLKRLMARIDFSLDQSLFPDFELQSVCLRQVPRLAYPFRFETGSRTVGTADVASRGDSASVQDLQRLKEGGRISFYTLENCHGDLLPQNNDPWKKIPDKIPFYSTLCTFIEVKGNFSTTSIFAGDIIYRFYIGRDNVKNFDINGNTIYDIRLCATDSNFEKLSWKVSSDKLVNPNYIDSWLIAMHSKDELCVGEYFSLVFSLPKRQTDYLGQIAGNHRLCFIPADGNAQMEFEPISQADSLYAAKGCCTSPGKGSIWLVTSNGEKKALLMDTVTAVNPEFRIRFRNNVNQLTVNEDTLEAEVSLVDKKGQFLHVNMYGVNYDLFSIDMEPRAEETGLYAIFDSRPTGLRSGPFWTAKIRCTNSGEDAARNSRLAAHIFGQHYASLKVSDKTNGIGANATFRLVSRPIHIRILDSALEKISSGSQMMLSVRNTSGLPLNFNVWQVCKTNNYWNEALYRTNEYYVRNNLDIRKSGKFIHASYDAIPVYGTNYKFVSDMTPSGKPYMTIKDEMLYMLEGIDSRDLSLGVNHCYLGAGEIYTLIDITSADKCMIPGQYIVLEDLPKTSAYEAKYGKLGFNHKETVVWSNGRFLLPSPTAWYRRLYPELIDMLLLENSESRYLPLQLTYNSTDAGLSIRKTIHSLKGEYISVCIDGQIDGMVYTRPNGLDSPKVANICNALIRQSTTTSFLDRTEIRIDKGAIAAALDEIYNTTFTDSDGFGPMDRFKHRAHPTDMQLRIRILLDRMSLNDIRPVEMTLPASTFTYYHEQDRKTYTCTLRITCEFPYAGMVSKKH